MEGNVIENVCCLCGYPIGPEQYTRPECSEEGFEVTSKRDALMIVACRLTTHHENMYIPEGKCRIELLKDDRFPAIVHEECWKDMMHSYAE